MAKVMKMILVKQNELGVKVSSNIKEHLELGPIPKRELEEACMRDLERVFAGSSASPWWLLTHGHVLEHNILYAQPQHPDTPKTKTPIGSFQFSVHLMNPTTLFIILKYAS